MASSKKVHIVGGGLAGSEAAWQLARPCPVLHEMRRGAGPRRT
jgi:folate-dependent tRNA-U54 methylase TrmFO/GidA